jgi:hypothetical protein
MPLSIASKPPHPEPAKCAKERLLDVPKLPSDSNRPEKTFRNRSRPNKKGPDPRPGPLTNQLTLTTTH